MKLSEITTVSQVQEVLDRAHQAITVLHSEATPSHVMLAVHRTQFACEAVRKITGDIICEPDWPLEEVEDDPQAWVEPVMSWWDEINDCLLDWQDWPRVG